ncbi:MAG TPA: hypothetical protein EYP04_03240, partial [Anaerolineae bacterium]|nr:hypothetical protein [Anaerolineae bacterium]
MSQGLVVTPTPTPTIPSVLPQKATSQPQAVQAFPWHANEIVYDGAQLCGDQREPDIAVDGSGNAYAIWADCRNVNGDNNWDIYFAYCPVGGNWEANVKVNDDAGCAWQGTPSIAVDADGNAYA